MTLTIHHRRIYYKLQKSCTGFINATNKFVDFPRDDNVGAKNSYFTQSVKIVFEDTLNENDTLQQEHLFTLFFLCFMVTIVYTNKCLLFTFKIWSSYCSIMWVSYTTTKDSRAQLSQKFTQGIPIFPVGKKKDCQEC